MARILVHVKDEREVSRRHDQWARAQPKQPGEIGRIWGDVRGNANTENILDMYLPDAFVADDLDGSGIAFTRA